jgi:hypothetical protein
MRWAVLLHAMGITATMWLPNAEELSSEHRVYAVDIIGDPGRSRLGDPRVHPKTGAAYLRRPLIYATSASV